MTSTLLCSICTPVSDSEATRDSLAETGRWWPLGADLSVGRSAGFRDRLDVQPVRPGEQVDLQRDAEVQRTDHLPTDQLGQAGDLLVGGLEDQLVVDLEQHPRRRFSVAQLPVDPD